MCFINSPEVQHCTDTRDIFIYNMYVRYQSYNLENVNLVKFFYSYHAFSNVRDILHIYIV